MDQQYNTEKYIQYACIIMMIIIIIIITHLDD